MLHKRKKCSVLPPQWLDKERLSGADPVGMRSESTAAKTSLTLGPACTAMLQDEKAATQFFQPLPFYYVEISKLLFHDAVEAFGDTYMEVRPVPTQ